MQWFEWRGSNAGGGYNRGYNLTLPLAQQMPGVSPGKLAALQCSSFQRM